MDKSKQRGLLAIIAAICFAAYGLFAGNAVVQTIFSVSPVRVNFYEVFLLLFCLMYLVLAATLLIRNRKSFLVAAGVCAAFWVVQIFSAPTLPLFLEIVSYTVLVFLFYALDGNPLLRKLWFIPAAVLFITGILSVSSVYRGTPLSRSWPGLVLAALETLALLFSGLWLLPSAPSPVPDPANPKFSE